MGIKMRNKKKVAIIMHKQSTVERNNSHDL